MIPNLPVSGDPARDSLLVSLVVQNQQIQTAAHRLLGPLLLPEDLTMPQLRALGTLAQEPGLSGHDLGVRLGVSAPTASGMIDRLAEKGLVERTEDAQDRRVRRVYLTAEGEAIIGSTSSVFDKLLGRVMDQVSTEELEVMVRGTQALLGAVQRVLAEDDATDDVS